MTLMNKKESPLISNRRKKGVNESRLSNTFQRKQKKKKKTSFEGFKALWAQTSLASASFAVGTSYQEELFRAESLLSVAHLSRESNSCSRTCRACKERRVSDIIGKRAPFLGEALAIQWTPSWTLNLEVRG